MCDKCREIEKIVEVQEASYAAIRKEVEATPELKQYMVDIRKAGDADPEFIRVLNEINTPSPTLVAMGATTVVDGLIQSIVGHAYKMYQAKKSQAEAFQAIKAKLIEAKKQMDKTIDQVVADRLAGMEVKSH
jgi:hypothetical protein